MSSSGKPTQHPLPNFLRLLRAGNEDGMVALVFDLERPQLLFLKRRHWCECDCPLLAEPCGCDQELFRFVWSATKEIVADDLAEGRWPLERIARVRGASPYQIQHWQRHPEFQAKVRELALALEVETGIPRTLEPPPLLQLAPCGCPVKWRPCPHTPAEPLPYRVAAALLYRLYPAEYGEPPVPAESSLMRSQDDSAWTAMKRRQGGFGLRHPDDHRQRLYDRD